MGNAPTRSLDGENVQDMHLDFHSLSAETMRGLRAETRNYHVMANCISNTAKVQQLTQSIKAHKDDMRRRQRC